MTATRRLAGNLQVFVFCLNRWLFSTNGWNGLTAIAASSCRRVARKPAATPRAGPCETLTTITSTSSRRAASACSCARRGARFLAEDGCTSGPPFATKPGKSSKAKHVPIAPARQADWKCFLAEAIADTPSRTSGDTQITLSIFRWEVEPWTSGTTETVSDQRLSL